MRLWLSRSSNMQIITISPDQCGRSVCLTVSGDPGLGLLAGSGGKVSESVLWIYGAWRNE